MTPTEELVERARIGDALARFCELVDAYDIDGLAAIFTADCVSDYGPGAGGPIAGWEPLRERLRKSQGRFAHTHHQLGQVRLAELSSERARSVSYVTASHRFHDGARLDIRFQYHDEWTRTPTGWRIRERRALATVIDGADTERNWVPRRSA